MRVNRVNFDAIPHELRERPRWVLWRGEKRDGKLTKVPYAARTGTHASVTDPATWCDFDTARAAAHDYDGIGLVLTLEDDIIGIDLDKCVNPKTGVIAPWAQAVVKRMNTYTEHSPSGMGLRLFLLGKLPPGRRKGNGVEVYETKRFLTVTGHRVPDTLHSVESRTEEVSAWHAEVFPAAEARRASANSAPRSPISLSDDKLLTKAMNAKNGAAFAALYRGDTSAYDGDDSRADLALCCHLAFWTGGDAVRIDRMFRQSGLYRAKWERVDYRQPTIEAALKGTHEFYDPTKARAPRAHTDKLQAALADARPKIRLPGSDRLLSDFATELVEQLRAENIFVRNGEVVILVDDDLYPVAPQSFRTWVEQHVIGYRAKTIGENVIEFDVTMSNEEARGVLASPQFIDGLRRVHRLNHARLPIFDTDGKLTLLPVGYHAGTQTLTLSDVDYDLEMPLSVAVETIDDLLAEFRFVDGQRSKSVAVAATEGLFANQLLPERSLRPCFIFLANAEGAGKGLLAQICVAPTHGAPPIGTKSAEDDEVRKVIATAVREAHAVLFFDNLKGHLSSPALEAFLSAPVWKDRKLGVNENIVGDNLATVFITGNGLTVSPDMRRRSLFVELHLEVERAEDREFKRLLDTTTLLAMRPNVLAALWAMLRHWNTQGRPAPSRSHSAFPRWARIVGGIVEAAGFGCPLATANVAAVADSDGEDMRRLVSAMASRGDPLTFAELVELARSQGCFEHLIGADAQDNLGRKEKSTLSRLLTRYDRRIVGQCRFIVEGKSKTRRYKVESGHGGHGVSPPRGNSYARELDGKTMPTMSTIPTEANKREESLAGSERVLIEL